MTYERKNAIKLQKLEAFTDGMSNFCNIMNFSRSYYYIFCSLGLTNPTSLEGEV